MNFKLNNMDARTQEIMKIYNINKDCSFKASFIEQLLPRRYTIDDLKKQWISGIEYGIEIGMRAISPNGQKVELYNNSNSKQTEFLNKFYELAEQYKCAIQYHPLHGMIVIDRET